MSERLQPGDTAPAFTLPDADGNEVSLADHKGRKVIVYFYPAALTPGCTKQACDFTDNLDVLAAAGYDVIGVSPDKPEKLAKFREKENLKVTLVGDPSKEILEAYGAFGEKKLYGKVVTGVIRSTVVVDEDGKVEHAFYNVKATGHVAKILRDLSIEVAVNRVVSDVKARFTHEDGAPRLERVVPAALVAVAVIGLLAASSRRRGR